MNANQLAGIFFAVGLLGIGLWQASALIKIFRKR
jgi:hypothetical protein